MMVPSTTRRRVLAATPAISLGAGCMGSLPFRDEPASPPVALGKISVINDRTARTTADITVRRDGRLVYGQSHTLDGREGNRAEMVTVVEPWMGRNVAYEVTIIARNPRVEAVFSTSDAEQFVEDWGENECFHVQFSIATDEISTALGGMRSCESSSADTLGAGDVPTPSD